MTREEIEAVVIDELDFLIQYEEKRGLRTEMKNSLPL